MSWRGSLVLARLDPINSPEATAGVLKRELGVTIRAKQDQATIKALTNPADFIDQRSTEINQLVENKVAKHYNEKYESCIELGLPESTSRELAVREATRFYEDELAMLELTCPGAYNAAFEVGNIMSVGNRAINRAADTDMIGRRAVRHYKRKKRSSKKRK